MEPIRPITDHQLLERLHVQGNVNLFRARHERNGELRCLVGLRVSATTPNSEEETRIQHFMEEGRALMALGETEHVLQTFAVARTNVAAWLSHEVPEGVSLATLLTAQEEAISCEAALALGAQIGVGLAALADKQIVHRDLRPDNLFLSADGRVSLGGFGLNFESSYDRLSAGQVPLTQVDFLSPELVEDDMPPTPRADVYALGAILYTLLSRRAPHRGSTLFNLLRSITQTSAPSLRQICPSVDPELDDLIAWCMEWDPDDRPLPQDVSSLFRSLAERLGYLRPNWEYHSLATLWAKCQRTTAQPERLVLCLRGVERVIERPLLPNTPLEVGRGRDSSITLGFGWISRRHARFLLKPEGVYLEDLGSANGTQHNGERVTKQVRLKEGDHVAFGKSRFEVLLRRAQAQAQQLTPNSAEEESAAEKRLRTGLQAVNFQILAEIPPAGLLRRYRVQRRKQSFVVSAVELGNRTAKLFSKRSQKALTLSHPYLLPTVDLQIHDGFLFVLNADTAGQCLEQRIQNGGTISTIATLQLAMDLCALAQYLKEQDVPALIRPGLIFMDPVQRAPRLTYAGLAPALLDTIRLEPGAESQPCYEGPEVVKITQSTEQSLVYALGATLSFCLSGHPVAELRGEERFDLLPPQAAGESSRLAELIAHATAPAPHDRPESLAVFEQQLGSILDQERAALPSGGSEYARRDAEPEA